MTTTNAPAQIVAAVHFAYRPKIVGDEQQQESQDKDAVEKRPGCNHGEGRAAGGRVQMREGRDQNQALVRGGIAAGAEGAAIFAVQLAAVISLYQRRWERSLGPAMLATVTGAITVPDSPCIHTVCLVAGSIAYTEP